MRSLSHMLLAILLTISSPAWCACALAEASLPASQDDQSSQSCCPGEQEQPAPADSPDSDDSSDDAAPCRDRSDCACCDATPDTTAAIVKNTVDRDLRAACDLAPILPAIAAILAQPLPTRARGSVAINTGDDPPSPSFASSLHAQRCLMLV